MLGLDVVPVVMVMVLVMVVAMVVAIVWAMVLLTVLVWLHGRVGGLVQVIWILGTVRSISSIRSVFLLPLGFL